MSRAQRLAIMFLVNVAIILMCAAYSLTVPVAIGILFVFTLLFGYWVRAAKQ